MRLLLLTLLTLLALLCVAPAQLVAAPSPERTWSFLVEWEGYRDRPYRDGPGWSVGLGHSLTAHRERGIWDRPYTHAEITRLFYRDLAWVADCSAAGVARFDAMPEAAQLVCYSVAWTVGRTGFHRFTGFRAALSQRNWPAAAHALQQSKWARDVGPRRTAHHAALLLSLSSP